MAMHATKDRTQSETYYRRKFHREPVSVTQAGRARCDHHILPLRGTGNRDSRALR